MPVCNEYQLILEEATSRKKQIKKFFNRLKKFKNIKIINKLFNEVHFEVYKKIDCLKCANCCRTISPIITDSDIIRIAKGLGIKPSEFTEKYLMTDADNDYVFKSPPCPFLNLDNHFCIIYESRPKACREYPHTDHKKVTSILDITYRNTFVCPVVYLIVKRLEKKII